MFCLLSECASVLVMAPIASRFMYRGTVWVEYSHLGVKSGGGGSGVLWGRRPPKSWVEVYLARAPAIQILRGV